ncbi:LexA family transcriptional regulator [Aliivibrio fischeri]|uniref:LexA family transcriptional regulator n=1 Tax=Aliivibrio fischeri TaxID=668 RepID=UPI00107E64DE|nr:LexA family transcriptional regulator [Aliivibrio fischeri]TGA68011.1 LexA family transcriptional regulator [Aliivibrio fischeri]
MLLKNKEKKYEEKIKKFPSRLKEVMEGESIRAFSKKTGLSYGALQSYLTGKSMPSLDNLGLIADSTNVSMEWLASGDVANSKLIKVPHYDLVASAGCGALVEYENPIAEFSFSRKWLQIQGLLNKTLSVIQVAGDSMEPNLYDGDLILIRHEEIRDGICVIRIDNDILVKRVQYDYAEQAYLISSDNKQYKPFKITPEFGGDFQVIAQVVRVLQRVRNDD